MLLKIISAMVSIAFAVKINEEFHGPAWGMFVLYFALYFPIEALFRFLFTTMSPKNKDSTTPQKRMVAKLVLVVLSIAAYATIWDFWTGCVILTMIYIHENGHQIAMRHCGLKTGDILMLPFMGGIAYQMDEAKSREHEVFITLMGPFFGLLCAIVCVAFFVVTGSEFWMAAVFWICLINLFNLLPLGSLDGGRWARAISSSLHPLLGIWVGCFGALALGILGMFLLHSPAAILIGVMGGMESWGEFRKYRKGNQCEIGGESISSQQTPAVVPMDRAGIVVSVLAYAVLIAGLSMLLKISL